MTHDEKRNSEGYYDPTPYAALTKISKNENRVKRLKNALCEICALSGFRLKGHITLIDKKTGRSYRL